MKKISLTKLPFKSFIVSISILLIIILSFWIYFDIYIFQKESINKIKSSILKEKKTYLKTVVSTIFHYIDHQSNSVEYKLTSQVKEETNKVFNIVSHIYNKYKNIIPKNRLEEIIIESIRPMRYNNNMGYFFAFNSKGDEKLFAVNPTFEGKNLIDFKDAKGNYVIKDMIKIAFDKGKGFYTYYWTKPNKKNLKFIYKKKAFIRYFKPLDLIIGTGFYYDDMEKSIKDDIKKYLVKFRFGKNQNNYIFVGKLIKKKGKFKLIKIVNPNSKFPLFKKELSLNITDLKGKYFRKEIIRNCIKYGNGFVKYFFKRLNSDKVSEKISYVKLYSKWQWIIGAGLYMDEINTIINKEKSNIAYLIYKKIIITLTFVLIAFLIAFYIFKNTNRKIEKELDNFFISLESNKLNSKKFQTEEFSILADKIKSFITKIEEQNEILQAYYNKPKIANFVVNEKGNFEKVNKAFEEVTEYTEEEAKNIKFFEIIHPDFREVVKDRGIKRLKGENVIPEYDIKIITKNKKIKWIKLINSHIYLKSEKKNILLGSGIDITEQKLLMDKLNEQYELFKTLIDSLDIPVWVFDTEKNSFQMVNKYFYEFFEIKEDIIGKEPQEIFPEKIYLKANETNIEVINTKKKVQCENNIKLSSGIKKILISKSPIFDKNGNVVGIVGLSIDITEKLKMERLKNIESLGILAGGIAHDFNNILAAILGNINLLQLYLKDEKPVKILQSLEKSINRAQKLTKKLLTFSKGNFLFKESANIVEIVKEIAEFITTGTSIKIEYNIEKNIPMVMIDKEQFSEVIHNIILNARQSMEQTNGKVIKIGIVKRKVEDIPNLKKGDYIAISIKDSGYGIDPEIIDYIFDPYFTTKQTGSGLGLATSYSIIKQHGGLITVDSIVGKGTKFTIYIPLIYEYKEPSAECRTKEKNNSLERSKKMNILILEDEKEIREVLKELMTFLGHNAKFAKKGEEAVDIFKKENFDMVITDLTIKGGMGGVDTVKEIRKINKNIPVVASTGYSTSKIAENFKEYGFDAILLKPFDLEKLKKLIEKIQDSL